MPPVIAAVSGIATAIAAAAGGGAIATGESLPESTEFAGSGWPVIEETGNENAVED